MSRPNYTVLTIEAGAEHVIVSTFLPQVGQRLILGWINQEVEVLEVSFTGKTHMISFSGIERGHTIQHLDDGDWLTPHLRVEIVTD